MLFGSLAWFGFTSECKVDNRLSPILGETGLLIGMHATMVPVSLSFIAIPLLAWKEFPDSS